MYLGMASPFPSFAGVSGKYGGADAGGANRLGVSRDAPGRPQARVRATVRVVPPQSSIRMCSTSLAECAGEILSDSVEKPILAARREVALGPEVDRRIR